MGAGVSGRWEEEEEEEEKAQILRHMPEGRILARCPSCPGVVRLQPILPLQPCPPSSTCTLTWGRKEQVRRQEKSPKATCYWPSARGSSSRGPSPTTAPDHASHDDSTQKTRVGSGSRLLVFVDEIHRFGKEMYRIKRSDALHLLAMPRSSSWRCLPGRGAHCRSHLHSIFTIHRYAVVQRNTFCIGRWCRRNILKPSLLEYWFWPEEQHLQGKWSSYMSRRIRPETLAPQTEAFGQSTKMYFANPSLQRLVRIRVWINTKRRTEQRDTTVSFIL